jgi:hypothetical protein
MWAGDVGEYSCHYRVYAVDLVRLRSCGGRGAASNELTELRQMFRVTINNQSHEFVTGTTILQALNSAGSEPGSPVILGSIIQATFKWHTYCLYFLFSGIYL